MTIGLFLCVCFYELFRADTRLEISSELQEMCSNVRYLFVFIVSKHDVQEYDGGCPMISWYLGYMGVSKNRVTLKS